MQTIRYKFGGIMILGALLLAGTGCEQEGHRRKQKEIQLERMQEQKATSDLSEAVKATDEAGWDAATAYQRFSDTVRPRLIGNKQTLANLNRVSQGRMPLRHRRLILKLEHRNAELGQRLDGCRTEHTDDWDDFTTLYLYDLQKLERDIAKLNAKNRQRRHGS